MGNVRVPIQVGRLLSWEQMRSIRSGVNSVMWTGMLTLVKPAAGIAVPVPANGAAGAIDQAAAGI